MARPSATPMEVNFAVGAPVLACVDLVLANGKLGAGEAPGARHLWSWCAARSREEIQSRQCACETIVLAASGRSSTLSPQATSCPTRTADVNARRAVAGGSATPHLVRVLVVLLDVVIGA